LGGRDLPPRADPRALGAAAVSLADLGLIYLIGGLASAIGIWRLTGSAASALLAVAIWPLWAPVAFMDPKRKRAAAPAGVGERVAEVLDEAREAAAGTPFEAMLNGAAAARIAAEVDRAAERLE